MSHSFLPPPAPLPPSKLCHVTHLTYLSFMHIPTTILILKINFNSIITHHYFNIRSLHPQFSLFLVPSPLYSQPQISISNLCLNSIIITLISNSSTQCLPSKPYRCNFHSFSPPLFSPTPFTISLLSLMLTPTSLLCLEFRQSTPINLFGQ